MPDGNESSFIESSVEATEQNSKSIAGKLTEPKALTKTDVSTISGRYELEAVYGKTMSAKANLLSAINKEAERLDKFGLLFEEEDGEEADSFTEEDG